MNFLDFFNPFKYFNANAYEHFFVWLFATLFNGWLARVLGFLFLILAYWFWIRREQMARGIGFLIMAFIMGYGWVLFRLIGVAK